MSGDRAVSLNAVINIVSDMRDLCREDVLQDTLKQLQQLPVKLQPCEDAISRKDAEKRIDEALSNVFVNSDGIGEGILSILHSITPERPKGYWIGVSCYDAFGGDYVTWMAHGDPIAYHYCSECKEECYIDEDGKEILSDFCPFCGSYNGGDDNADRG